MNTLEKAQPQSTSPDGVRFDGEERDVELAGDKVPEDHSVTPEGPQLVGLHVAGIRRAEAAKVLLGPYERGVIYFGILLSAWAIALSGTVHGTYQGYATGEWNLHSLLATVGVVTSVCSAVLQPVGAKFADYFGRWEVLCAAVGLYTLGSIVEASAKNLETFCGGNMLRSFGYALCNCIYQVIVADYSSLRTRTFWVMIPTAPAIVNAWVSGDIAERVLLNTTWRWGIGLWAIIAPVASIPLAGMLLLGHWRAVRAGTMPSHRELARASNTTWTSVFWQLDIVGAFLLAAAFALFFIPFTIAGYAKGNTTSERWSQPQIVACLVLGILCFPVFGYWQKKAKYPIVPYKLLKDRGIVAAICLAVVLSTARVIQNNFLYAMMLVGFNQSVKSAQRITQLYVFTSNLSGVVFGLIILYFRRLKLVILCGCAVYMVGYGLLIRYRHGDNVGGVIGAEVVLGLGAGMMTFTTLASAQARTKHEHVAIITGVYLGSSFFGFGIGGAIAGAMWTQYMPTKLDEYLAPINATLSRAVFGDPYRVALRYAAGSAERIAITAAYADVQKLLTVVGICVSALLFACALLLRDTELVDAQSHPDAEGDSERGSVMKRKHWLWR